MTERLNVSLRGIGTDIMVAFLPLVEITLSSTYSDIVCLLYTSGYTYDYNACLLGMPL